MNNPFSLNRNVVFLWLLLAPGVSILLPQALFKRVGGMMSPVWSVGSSMSQLYTPALRFAVKVIDKSLFHVQSGPERLAWEGRRTFRLVLERGWLRLLNLHGSDGVSTGSLWSSGVTPSVPGSWYIPMETGRSFLGWKEKWQKVKKKQGDSLETKD